MESIEEKKRAMRAMVRARKGVCCAEQLQGLSECAVSKLERLSQFVAARTVLLYWSLPDEVQTHVLVERYLSTKTVLLPRVEGSEAVPVAVSQLDQLQVGSFGILEPRGALFAGEIDLIIVPGVAFDRFGHRLGRGGGYYDRLLAAHPQAITVGLALDFQLVDLVPTLPHDRSVECARRLCRLPRRPAALRWWRALRPSMCTTNRILHPAFVP